MSEELGNVLQDGVRTLTLNRPEKRNALSAELVDALRHALTAAADDPETRALVLTGAGDRVFCAGADLNPAAALAGPIANHRSRQAFVELLRTFQRAGKPIVARINGHVLAGGMGLLAAADLAIAADDVHFSTPEVKVGLFPMMIMALIVRNVGRKHALELLMTGERMSAERAAEIGLINRCVPRQELDAATQALALRLASFSPVVMRLGRDAFYTMEDMPLDGALDYLCSQLSLNTLTEDAAEGVMAFIQKRAPEWKGR